MFTEPPLPSTAHINLLDAGAGAKLVSSSTKTNSHSSASKLLLPGRREAAFDGWHSEEGSSASWSIFKLSSTALLKLFEVDTASCRGDQPLSAKIEATLSTMDVPAADAEWIPVVNEQPLGPLRQHWFNVEQFVPPAQVFSHVRFTVRPSGKIQRLRAYGHPFDPKSADLAFPEVISLHALPLTVEAYAPYGQVIQAYSSADAAPRGKTASLLKGGSGITFHRMSKIEETYPPGLLVNGGLGIGLLRAGPEVMVGPGLQVNVEMLERHACTTQAFVPLARGANPPNAALAPGGGFIVVVALNGEDDRPDLKTLKAFVGTSAQGASYDAGIWHSYVFTIDGTLDLACVEAQISDGSHILDLEKYIPNKPWLRVYIPGDRSTVSNASTIGGVAQKSVSHPSNGSVIKSPGPVVQARPLTEDLFKPYGDVVGYKNAQEREGLEVYGNAKGNKTKICRLTQITNSYPKDAGAYCGISVSRIHPTNVDVRQAFPIERMQRRPMSSATVIPMGKGEWTGKGESALDDRDGSILVIVADNGANDRPDHSTLKAFVMPPSIGVNLKQGVWHHAPIALGAPFDLMTVEAEVANGDHSLLHIDIETVDYSGEEALGLVQL